jgi:hypothetical protein
MNSALHQTAVTIIEEVRGKVKGSSVPVGAGVTFIVGNREGQYLKPPTDRDTIHTQVQHRRMERAHGTPAIRLIR